MLFRGKNFEQIEKANLLELVKEKVKEDQWLEYKSKMYGKQPHDKIEMLKDITAMANAEGGFLIIGIEEDKNAAAKKLLGIDNGEVIKDDILKSCNSSIEDKILGPTIRPIDIGKSKSVLIIYIPKSTRKPHMVTFDRHNKFYIRHDRHNLPMSLNEIREAFLTMEDYVDKHKKFIDSRKVEIKEDANGELKLVLYATPIVIDKDIIDTTDASIRELLRNPPDYQGWLGSGMGVHPSFYGLVVESPDKAYRLELNRNGHIELIGRITPFSKDGKTFIPVKDTEIICKFLIIFLSLTKSLYELTNTGTPVCFYLSLYNSKNLSLGNEVSPDEYAFTTEWKRYDLTVQTAPIEDLGSSKVIPIAKSLMDKLFNSFREERCLYFSREGQYLGRW